MKRRLLASFQALLAHSILWSSGLRLLGGDVIVPLQVDAGTSRLDLTVCVQSAGCDVDSHPLTGTLWIEFDEWWRPTRAALRDFQFRSASNFDFSFFGGDLRGIVSNLTVEYVRPGPPRPFDIVAGDQVTFRDLSSRLGGMVHYDASATVCGLLIAGGLACPGDVNLSERTLQPLEELPVLLELSGHTLRITTGFRFGNFPLFESIPTLGSISGLGTIHASAPFLPRLRIESLAFEYRVRWPSAYAEFHLDRASSLQSPVVWEPVEESNIENDGTIKTAAFGYDSGPAYYRLREVPAGGK